MAILEDVRYGHSSQTSILQAYGEDKIASHALSSFYRMDQEAREIRHILPKQHSKPLEFPFRRDWLGTRSLVAVEGLALTIALTAAFVGVTAARITAGDFVIADRRKGNQEHDARFSTSTNSSTRNDVRALPADFIVLEDSKEENSSDDGTWLERPGVNPSRPGSDFGPRVLERTVSAATIAKLNLLANSNGITLNAILLGWLATHLSVVSGQRKFAISQTYLGREPDQLQAIGSFSVSVPLEFDFAQKLSVSSPLVTSQHVFKETMENMASPERLFAGSSLISNIGYELNDVRPKARPQVPPLQGVILCDMFFLMNQYTDGFVANVAYSTGKFSREDVEALLDGWLKLLETC